MVLYTAHLKTICLAIPASHSTLCSSCHVILEPHLWQNWAKSSRSPFVTISEIHETRWKLAGKKKKLSTWSAPGSSKHPNGYFEEVDCLQKLIHPPSLEAVLCTKFQKLKHSSQQQHDEELLSERGHLGCFQLQGILSFARLQTSPKYPMFLWK